MAKSPDKTAGKPAAKKPKAAPKLKMPKPSEKAAGPKAASSKPSAAKPKAVGKPKPAVAEGSASALAQFAKDTGDTISKLASDILADRIIPTIDQIKSVAAHALGQEEKAKTKRKTPIKKTSKK